ncbi:MAG: efflux RND transporter periplasmic adaptor subunit [Spirochaeta sp.]
MQTDNVKTSRRGFRVAAAAAALIVILIFIGLPLWRTALGEDEAESHQGILVELMELETERFEEMLRYPGTVTPNNNTVVTPKLAGEVLEIHVNRNDVVQPGDLLVSIDDSMARLQADQARAGVRAAQAQLDQARRGVRAQELENARASVQQAEDELQTARRNLERTERLYEAGTISRSEYEDAQNAFQSANTQVENARRSVRLMEEGASAEELQLAQANLDSAEKQLELAELQLNYAEVRAPIGGRVVDIMAEEGNMASTSTALAAIIGDDHVQVTTALPEERYELFAYRVGDMQVRIHPIAYPEASPFPGVVANVSSLIQRESRTFEVEVAVENPQGRLRPGMFANLEFVVNVEQEAILVPSSAVLTRDNQQVVYTVEMEDGSPTAHMLPVSVGARQDGQVLITDGLEPGMQIVIRGNTYLEDGQLVRFDSETEVDL